MTTELDPAEAARQVADRDAAVEACIFAADAVFYRNPGVRGLPGADQVRIVVITAIGYLIGHGLITVTPREQWDRWLSVDVPEHLRVDVAAWIRRYTEMVDRVTGTGVDL